MAHDFAKQRPSEQKSRKNKGAAKRHSASPGTHWSWFFTGLLCGLFVAFAGYQGLLKPAPGQDTAAGEEADSPESGLARGVFDFYDYLPAAEVEVDVVPVEVDAAEESAPTQVAVVQAPPAEADEVQYLLQAGSFQGRDDAEARRASIILMNMQAKVTQGIVSGRTVHRVQVGPFSGRAATEAARDRLSSNNIESIVLRMK